MDWPTGRFDWFSKIFLIFIFTALVYYVPQFLESFGPISKFNCQPAEKKNHEQSRMFHRGTQKVVVSQSTQSRWWRGIIGSCLLESKTYCGSRGITLRRVAKTVAALPPTMITRKKGRGNFESWWAFSSNIYLQYYLNKPITLFHCQ